MSNRHFALLWAVWALAVFAGCAPSETVPVKGVLLRNGKPLPSYVVTFYPAQGRTSIAITDAEGRFEMIYTDKLRGVVRGKHKVTAHFAPPAVASYDAADNPVPPADAKAIQEKYGTPQTTQKEIEINEPQNDLQLTLD
jgi:hypothetical protein